jgi:hypothetical protein
MVMQARPIPTSVFFLFLSDTVAHGLNDLHSGHKSFIFRRLAMSEKRKNYFGKNTRFSCE